MMKLRLRCVLVSAMLLAMAVLSFAQGNESKAQSTDSAKVESAKMELIIFARFHAREREEGAVAAELHDAVARVSKEPGCLGIEVYRSVRDSRLFFLHSRWVNEGAFDKHVERPETNQFVERVQPLIDHPFDVTRTHLLFK
ncbi:MAG: putative quinol monooxygenase [Candidatus Sulfotelmatobacter sp.]|jgi:quinol monooxygenase YgiN